MPLTKKFLKSKPVCKVTFKVPAEAAAEADELYLVGDFNEWDKTAAPMKKLKKGDFSLTLDLETGKAYQYRYYAGNETWVDDPEPDRTEFSAFAGCENAVVEV
jgi:1,4-alpha-glucan branching enzyme